jgi:hypothetical protein
MVLQDADSVPLGRPILDFIPAWADLALVSFGIDKQILPTFPVL